MQWQIRVFCKKVRFMMKNIRSFFVYIALACFLFGCKYYGKTFNEEKEVRVVEDIGMYDKIMGENPEYDYQFKSGNHEEVFPRNITGLNVISFKCASNLWAGAEYVISMVVEYDDDTFEQEIKRLEKVGTQEYLGEYGNKGFNDKWRVCSVMISESPESHYGLTYALADEFDKTIYYVELLTRNLEYNMDYKHYIDEDLLPLELDMGRDNPYIKKYVND